MVNSDKVCFSWRLEKGINDNDVYIKILKSYKEYGFSSMTKLVAAALSEYSQNHSISASNDKMIM